MSSHPLRKIIAKCLISIASSVIAFAESILLVISQTSKFTVSLPNNIAAISNGDIVVLFAYLFISIISLVILSYTVFNAIVKVNECKKRIFDEKDKEKIDKFLTDFIESGESVAILSHDMSWVNDKNIEMLEEKARRKELLIFLPDETNKIKHLKELGADVRCFGKIISDPANNLIKSRMTIINWNKAFPKLTYPIKKNGLHINYEIESGEPANQLAQDLVQLLVALSPKTRQDIIAGMPTGDEEYLECFQNLKGANKENE